MLHEAHEYEGDAHGEDTPALPHRFSLVWNIPLE